MGSEPGGQTGPTRVVLASGERAVAIERQSSGWAPLYSVPEGKDCRLWLTVDAKSPSLLG